MPIKGRFLSRFPARVVGGTGVSVSKANSVYTFALSFGSLTALPSVAAGDRDNIFVAAYNSDGSGSYGRLSIETLLGISDFGIKTPVRAATTANITLSGSQTIDGVAVVSGDRVLVKDQSTGADNGIYVAANSAWARATDFDGSNDVVSGTQVFVTDGTTNGDTQWQLATANTISLGTTSISFSRSFKGGASPTTSTDNAIARYDGTGGALQNSGVTIDDSNNITGVGSLTVTGAFTGVSIAVSGAITAGNLTGSGTLVLNGDISPSQITAQVDDYNPTGLSGASTLRLTSDASRSITGLAGGADGRVLLVHNVGAQDIVLEDEHGSSTAANRFALNADVTLGADQGTIIQYDSTSSRWRLAAGGGGAAGALLAANNLSDVGSATTAFNNIKQAATTSATGVVEIATDAEMRTGTDSSRVPSVQAVRNGTGAGWASFSAHKNGSAQALGDATFTLVTFGTEIFDVGNFFASNLWTPPAGKCQMVGSLYATGSASVGSLMSLAIFKNGANYKQTFAGTLLGDQGGLDILLIEEADGTATYGLYAFYDCSTGTASISGSAAHTYFTGTMVN
jgi:hypothetical protein